MQDPTSAVVPSDPQVDPAIAILEGKEPETKETTTEPRPEWLPEKFKSGEDLAKAYDELQKKLGAPKPVEPETPPQQEEQLPQIPGVNTAEISEYYDTNGKLEDSHYDTLAKAGFNRDMVDAYIAGIEAKREAHETQMYTTAGGKEQFQQMVDWASKSLEPKAINDLNALLTSTNAAHSIAGVTQLKSLYDAAVHTEPQLQTGVPGLRGGSDVYTTWSQVHEAQRDRRYGRDVQYTSDIDAKILRSFK